MERFPIKKNLDVLSCPYCNSSLYKNNIGVKCSNCSREYGYSKEGQLDFRLHENKVYPLEFKVGNEILTEKKFQFKLLQQNKKPNCDFSNINIPHHLNKILMSYFPCAKTKHSLMLDIGCGDTVHRQVCEHAGFTYIGIDIDSPNATLLGDAHALPFRDNCFEFVLSIAVLEHIQYPFVMTNEVYRVLKPGGKFIGTVAFLEPFHSNSFYHHTHLGTYNSLKYAGFNIKNISPNKKWSVLRAQAKMSLFPKLPTPISEFLVMPLYLIHRLWWKIGSFLYRSNTNTEEIRIFNTTGSFSFIADKKEKK
jgi:SAM-dependent methyltransferase